MRVTSAGSMPAGPAMPCQTLRSKPGIVCAAGGVSGNCGIGRAEAPASARTLPSLIWPSAVETVMIAVSASSRSSAVSISAPER